MWFLLIIIQWFMEVCTIPSFWWLWTIFIILYPLTCSYGSTKCGLRQLQASLFKQCKRSKVGVHTASPGMVRIDLLLRYGIYIPAFCNALIAPFWFISWQHFKGLKSLNCWMKLRELVSFGLYCIYSYYIGWLLDMIALLKCLS